MNEIKYVHINIISKDWKPLAQFYISVFGCKPIYPERDLSGKWIDELTLVPHAHIQGIHLRLPGYENDGPTLEIFQYNSQLENSDKNINRNGFAHIAFKVNNFEELMKKILEHGGSKLGKLVTHDVPEVGELTVVYMKDPEDNIIELQQWKYI